MNAHYKCEGCGKYFDEGKNETTEAALTIPATGDHNYGAWVSNGNGTHTSTCTTCSHSETENCSGGTATCENKAVCSVCGAEYGEKLGHDWNDWVSNGDGTHTRTCKRDSGHTENANCSGGKATCTTKAVCDVCRTPYGDTVPHNTTQYGGKDSSGHWDTCSTCDNKFNFEAHTPDREKADETNPVKCTKCDFVIESALAHTTHHTTLVPGEDATCMKEGKKPYYRCDGCEVKFEDKEATKPITDESTLVIAKAHKFGAWVPEVPATEETEGVKGHKDCTFCGKHFDENGNEIENITLAKLVKVVIEVVGGTGGGRLTVGESATVTAEDKEGKVFAGWKDESGKIVSTQKEYTFTVAEGRTLTAVYEDAPVAKDGLSGGAIAGIVIGSVLLAGIGGFAIFWFAVKKKTFADLGVALKKGFTAIGNFFKNLGAKIKALFTKKK